MGPGLEFEEFVGCGYADFIEETAHNYDQLKVSE